MHWDKFDFSSTYADVRYKAGFRNRIAAISEAIRFWNNVERQFKTKELKKQILSYALGIAGSHNRPINPEELIQMNNDEEPMVLGEEHRSKTETSESETHPYAVRTTYSPSSVVLATRVRGLTYREVQQLAEELGMQPNNLADWAEWVSANNQSD